MQPTAIFLIGAASSGKSTIGKLLATEYQFTYLDKDIICNKLTGLLLESKGYSPHERDGNTFYSDTIMPLEYQTLLDVANDNLQLGRSVVLDAPFLSYFSNKDYIRELKEKYDWHHIRPLVLQVDVDFDILKERMKARGLERDEWKFAHWDAFVEGIRARRCLWEDIDIRHFDNSPAEVDKNRLHNTLSFQKTATSL
ncbi:AAA family ATPase [Paenibacillus farraposensis]|uniref:AAA family ATPase n=1 Tax=Paenibacillus farraposensis TaxID=2807095 RepID=A0ABW4DG28_9BACL|nr:ATP-binding protein [Paenibacillus farraposensis]MCC3380462.1 ATP-binding protein [Paenibacillus farraposensis]